MGGGGGFGIFFFWLGGLIFFWPFCFCGFGLFFGRRVVGLGVLIGWVWGFTVVFFVFLSAFGIRGGSGIGRC